MKKRLGPITGVKFPTTKLLLYSKADEFICSFLDEANKIGSYSVQDFMRIDLLEKFEYTAKEYEKRIYLVRAFKERNKIERFADLDKSEELRIAKKFMKDA